MQAFNVTGAENAQARNAGVGTQGGDFFLEGHQGKDVVDAWFDRQIGVLKRVLVLLREDGLCRREQKEEDKAKFAFHGRSLTASWHRTRPRLRIAKCRVARLRGGPGAKSWDDEVAQFAFER